MKKANLYMLVAVASIFMASVAIADTYPEGMISYWKLDEGDEAIASDVVGTNDGTIYGATWATGMVGNALSFDGTNDYVSTTFNPRNEIGNGHSYTKTFWLNQGVAIGGQLLVVCGSPGGRFYFGHSGTDQYMLGLGNQYTSPFTFPVNPVNTWSHVTEIFDSSSSEIRVYQNGNPSPVFTWNYGGDGVMANGNLLFSEADPACGYWNPFTGMLDEVAIYNRAITPEEIQLNYEKGLIGLGYEIPELTCNGFEPPMAAGAVTVKKNRVLPLKAQLFDADSIAVTDLDIAAPPVLQVMYSSGAGLAVEVTDYALPAGQGTEGNQFVYTVDGKWQFNLKTKNYTSPGTYTVQMVSGDAIRYVFEPKCEGTFVIK